eukprot:gb/GECH01009347.1/.p1 GENE.gb/GECH01009347.1/~~gb/GECH01009347.1/.p1  ORF type:complete len:301 (+),score=57.59 gb/GECH01009347.1/:1-903(+)
MLNWHQSQTLWELYTENYNATTGITHPLSPSFSVNDGSRCNWEWCPTQNICFGEPSLFPTCILALIIGVFTSSQIREKLEFNAKWMYSTTFFMFGCMMSTAAFVHCFSHFLDAVLQFILGIMDVGLTSCIAAGFFWCGLADVGLIDPRKIFSKFVFFGSFILIFSGWYYTLTTQWSNGFLVMYIGVVMVGCGTYLLTQLKYIISHFSMGTIEYLSLGGLAGIIGMFAMLRSQDICQLLGEKWGTLIGGDFWWFFMSDVAMYFLYRYVMVRKGDRGSADSSGTYQPLHTAVVEHYDPHDSI